MTARVLNTKLETVIPKTSVSMYSIDSMVI